MSLRIRLCDTSVIALLIGAPEYTFERIDDKISLEETVDGKDEDTVTKGIDHG